MHTISYIVGIICGLAICVIIGLLFRMRRCKTSGRGTVEFDERQQLARGKAYKTGFVTTLIYCLLFGALSATEIPFFQSVMGMLIGPFLGITVFAVTAIFDDAYLGLNENKRSFYILSIVICAANLAVGIMHGVNGELIENGQLTIDSLSLMLGVLFAIIPCALVIHDLRAKKEAVDE